MPRVSADIIFPLGGVDRSFAFQNQAPYTTRSATNAWPRDSLEQCLRGGSRPGTVAAFPSSPSSPCQMLANVRVAEISGGDREQTFRDSFDAIGEFGPEWTNATWGVFADHALSPPVSAATRPFLDSSAFAVHSPAGDLSSVYAGGLVMAPSGIDVGETYGCEIRILPDILRQGLSDPSFTSVQPENVAYFVFCRLDEGSPNLLDSGVYGYVLFLDGTLKLYAGAYVNGVLEDPEQRSIPLYFDGTSKLQLGVNGNAISVVYYSGDTITEATVTASASTRTGLGFGIASVGDIGETTRYHRVDTFRMKYTGPATFSTRNTTVVVGGANDSPTYSDEVDLRFEDTPGELSELGAQSTLTNPNGRPLMGVQLLGNLYIAGDDATDDPKIWKFDATGTGTLSPLSPAKDFNADESATVITSLAVWRSRLCVVHDGAPHNISMAAVGDPTDWTYGALPVGSAVRLNTTGIDTGELADAIYALLPHSDDYLLIGGRNSLHVLRGDPTYGGQIDKISGAIGVIGQHAWTLGPDNELLWLSTDGLYGLQSGVVARPESLSRERLPKELQSINTDQYRVMVAFDMRNRGVLIAVTPNQRFAGHFFWFDWETRGFWPLNFDVDHHPMAMVYQDGDDPTDQRLLLGCRDGAIRTFDLNAGTDDGVTLKSEYYVGPLMLGGGGYHDGMLLETIGQLGAGSNDVTMEVKVGNSVEEAWNATPRDAVTLRAGKNLTNRPRLRGNAAFLKVSGTGRWAMENMTVVKERLGKQRL